ncbi:MAG TPA: ATP-binding protein [Candidatus Paceibacterota bacterium]
MPIIFSIGHHKRDFFPVETEVDISTGIFRFDIIGLGDKAVGESKLRILAALKNSGHKARKTTERITVLLSPANRKKEGSHFDLPTALAYLCKTGIVIPKYDWVIFGELSLSGKVKRVPNILEYVYRSISFGLRHILIPEENLSDCMAAQELPSEASIYFASTLAQAIDIMNGKGGGQARIMQVEEPSEKEGPKTFLIDKVIGQEHMKRALAISLAGKHHLLISGAPGTGKSMLAKSAGELVPERALGDRIRAGSETGPLVQPHHTASYAQLIGTTEKPGIIALSHKRILLMDEWAEFDRRAIESLRQPLEEGVIHGEQYDFVCIATTNPCPCGFYQSRARKCKCAKESLTVYQKKIYGPVSQRFDLIVFSDEETGSRFKYRIASESITGKKIKSDIKRVRSMQAERESKLVRISPESGRIPRRESRLGLIEFINESVSDSCKKCLSEAVSIHKLSQRTADAILLVARTIADLDASEQVEVAHIAEATEYAVKENPFR